MHNAVDELAVLGSGLADAGGAVRWGFGSAADGVDGVPPSVRRSVKGCAHPARQALIAQRAAFGLPYGTLLRYSRDPLGDLQAERFEPLVAAALEDAGLRASRAHG